ncbi:MAG: monovalent cation/H+ antiporter complex subunit F [Sphingomonadaceae bacterium]
MAEFHYFAALAILASTAISLWRTLKGPTRADRMMGTLLVGTGGVAILVLLFLIHGQSGVLDVALLLALLAAFAAVGFVKSVSPDGAGDPEEEG